MIEVLPITLDDNQPEDSFIFNKKNNSNKKSNILSVQGLALGES